MQGKKFQIGLCFVVIFLAAFYFSPSLQLEARESAKTEEKKSEGSELQDSFWKRFAPLDAHDNFWKRNAQDSFWKRADEDSFWKRSVGAPLDMSDSFWKKRAVADADDHFWKRSLDSDMNDDHFWKKRADKHRHDLDSFWKRNAEEGDAFWK